jgi:hypothetical protein
MAQLVRKIMEFCHFPSLLAAQELLIQGSRAAGAFIDRSADCRDLGSIGRSCDHLLLSEIQRMRVKALGLWWEFRIDILRRLWVLHGRETHQKCHMYGFKKFHCEFATI